MEYLMAHFLDQFSFKNNGNTWYLAEYRCEYTIYADDTKLCITFIVQYDDSSNRAKL